MSLREVLKGHKAAQTAMMRAIARKCDWGDAEDRNFYRKDTARRRREKILDHLAENRKCPLCGELKIGSRQFVVNEDASVVICRSCFQRNVPQGGEVSLAGVFTEVKRYEIDPEKFRKARADSGLSLREFARRAGWNSGWQSRLENERVTVSQENVDVIITVFKGLGITVTQV